MGPNHNTSDARREYTIMVVRSPCVSARVLPSGEAVDASTAQVLLYCDQRDAPGTLWVARFQSLEARA